MPTVGEAELRMTAPLTCCVMQPSFLPWLGWFDLLDQSDILVVLDDAQFSKQSWQQRNRIRSSRGLEYLSIPVKTAGLMGQAINEVRIAESSFVDSFTGRILASYRDAPHFPSFGPPFSSILRKSASSGMLIDINIGVLTWLCSVLELEIEVVRASELGVAGRRGERVASLCEAVGAARYLSPMGAKDYLVEDLVYFDDRSLVVELHGYVHPEYRQLHQPFIPHACTLDLLMMHGKDSMSIIRSGRREATRLTAGIGERS